MVQGLTLSLPGEFSLESSTLKACAPACARRLYRYVRTVVSAKTRIQECQTYIPEHLIHSTCVFIRTYAVKRPLQQHHKWLFWVMLRKGYIFKVTRAGRIENITIDSLKLVCIKPDPEALTTFVEPIKFTVPTCCCSGEVIKLPSRYADWPVISAYDSVSIQEDWF